MSEPRDEFGELLRALVAGNVIDGVPVTSATIGELMAAHVEDLEQIFGPDNGGQQ